MYIERFHEKEKILNDIYEKVKNKSSEFCEIIEFDGFHQIDTNLIEVISSNMSKIF